jgi:tetratricopeptide (TPR) repeat protein
MLGEDHPGTLTSRNILALCYLDAGRVGEAIPLFERTLADRVRVLGDLHPDTLVSRNNLALAYQDTGRLVEAIALLEEAVVGFEQVLGARHPNTVTARNSLAGASSGAIQAMQDDVKGEAIVAYGKLHDLVKRRFRGNAAAEVVLSEYQADPQTYAGGRREVRRHDHEREGRTDR